MRGKSNMAASKMMIFIPWPIRPEGYCCHLCPSVSPTICYPSFQHGNLKANSLKFTKIAHMMYLINRQKSIEFGRSRSKVKVTSGRKVKKLMGHISKIIGAIHSKQNPKYTASKGLSSLESPCASFWNCTFGVKAQQTSKVKSTFSTII